MADKTLWLPRGLFHAAGYQEASGNFREWVANSLDGVVTGGSRSTDAEYGGVWAGTLDSSDNVEFPHQSDLDGATEFTILGLFKNNKQSIGSTGNENLFTMTGGGDDNFQVIWQNSENFYAEVFTSDGGFSDSIADGLDVDSTLADEWNILGMRWTGSLVQAFINNTFSTGVATTGTWNTTTHPLQVGGNGLDESWDGEIAATFGWTRSLSDAEIAYLVSNPLALFGGATGGGAPTYPGGGSGARITSRALQDFRQAFAAIADGSIEYRVRSQVDGTTIIDWTTVSVSSGALPEITLAATNPAEGVILDLRRGTSPAYADGFFNSIPLAAEAPA